MGHLLTMHSSHRQGLVLASNFPNVPRWVSRVVSLPEGHL